MTRSSYGVVTMTEKGLNPVSICNRCGMSWWRRSAKLPLKCPLCNSPYWNKKYIRKSFYLKRRNKSAKFKQI